MTPSKTKKQFNPDDTLKEVLKHPGARRVFKKYNLKCVKCGGMANEKLRHAAINHGLDVDSLIREISAED